LLEESVSQKIPPAGYELAIAIDWESEPGTSNPYITAVPTGLGKQEIIDLIYREHIEEELASGTDPEEVPYYRFEYLWHGQINPAGRVEGCECTRMRLPSLPMFQEMIEEARKRLGDELGPP